jgi:AbrB family looped-hinge helix DNA binding protein
MYYDFGMARTVVSTKFQVVIPKGVREETGLRKGQTFQVIVKGGVISLVPERPLAELKGFAPKARSAGFREKRDRL